MSFYAMLFVRVRTEETLRGISTAQALSNALDPDSFTIQLVTQRPFFIHYPAMARTVITSEGHLERRVFVPYDRIFSPGKVGEVIVGTAENIKKQRSLSRTVGSCATTG
ncbi:hypothetical protein FRC02_006733 [Tulasnella sp. 418]|nr:hypothetical protein FRC02_006733 [Tulasnella sp. 418]